MNENINAITTRLCRMDNPEPDPDTMLPSTDSLRELMRLCRDVILAPYFAPQESSASYVGRNLESINALLIQQTDPDVARGFIDGLVEVKRRIMTDARAVFDSDPAAKSLSEVILCYPGIAALLHHRVAHLLLGLGVGIVARIIAEMAHSVTGIDIHPGATIGDAFSIDHGTGVVIGETAIIGRNVRLYQGVTLGARSFKLDENGNPINTPRHPIIEDNVVIYSNTTVLGRITIGANSIVGGNLWLTSSIAPNSKVTQYGSDIINK